MPAAEVAARIRAGSLGQSADWARWNRITEIRLADLGRPDGLLSAADGALGAVFGPLTWSMRHGDPPGLLNFLGELALALEHVRFAREDADILVRMCGESVRQISTKLGAQAVVPVLRALMAGCRHAGATLDRNVLTAIVSMQLDEAEQLALLLEAAPLVRRDSGPFFHLDEEERFAVTCERLYEHALREGHAQAFLYALSLLPMSGVAKRVPASLLGSLDTGAEAHRQAALFLRLARLDWSTDEASALAVKLCGMGPQLVNSQYAIVDYIERQSAAGRHVEALLIGLATDAGATKPWAQSRWRYAEQLLQVFDKRPAPGDLPDPMARPDGAG